MATLEERAQAATNDAEESFWAIVAQAFPEAKSGDLDPMTAIALTTLMRDAVGAWVRSNVPGAEEDVDL